MCIDVSLFGEHNCKVGRYMQNCPICQEDLFSSRSASHEMPCGHAIHWHCFRELAAHDSRCPVCKKTAETHARMAPTWNAMAMGIELQPVPPDLAKVVTIMCNDCEETHGDRAWHFLGVQCRSCSSFNTVVESIQMVGRTAHEYLEVHDPHPASPVGRRISLAERRLEQAEQERQALLQVEAEVAERDARVQAQAEAQYQVDLFHSQQQQQAQQQQQQQVVSNLASSLVGREAHNFARENHFRDLYRQQVEREEARRRVQLEEQTIRREEQRRSNLQYQQEQQIMLQQQQSMHQSQAQQAPQQSHRRFNRRNSGGFPGFGFNPFGNRSGGNRNNNQD